MKEVTPSELQAMRDKGTMHQLIDIRERYELEEGHIEGLHIPMEDVFQRLEELSRDQPCVIHCRTGKRAEAVITLLERKFGFQNLYCLKGGIKAYSEEVDASIIIT